MTSMHLFNIILILVCLIYLVLHFLLGHGDINLLIIQLAFRHMTIYLLIILSSYSTCFHTD